jgi:opacity protein-like surface antigen
MKPHRTLHTLIAALLVLISVLCVLPAQAAGHLGLYGVQMTPYGRDAGRYSRAGFGGGIQAVVPLPRLANLLAGVTGLEVVNLLSETTKFQDQITGFTVEQQTNQRYGRLYLGARLGLHGHEFFRPYAGANLSLNFYSISTDVVVPNDSNRENEIRQNLRSENRAAFGYDGTLGVDLDIATRFNLDGGVRYVKTFNVPQQLGEDSVPINPEYFQVFLGFGVSFELMQGRR